MSNSRALPAILKIVSASASSHLVVSRSVLVTMQSFWTPTTSCLRRTLTSYQLCWEHPENSQREAKLEPGIQLLDLLSGGWTMLFSMIKACWPLAKDQHTQRCRSWAGKQGQKGSNWWVMTSASVTPWMLWLDGWGWETLRARLMHWSAGETEAHRQGRLLRSLCLSWTVPGGPGWWRLNFSLKIFPVLHLFAFS